MSDPAAYLADKLAEVEAVANAATPGPWHVAHDYFGPCVQAFDGFSVADERDNDHHAQYATGEPLVKADCAHVALNDPAHVLRLVAATRNILELHHFDASEDGAPVLDRGGRLWCPLCSVGDGGPIALWPCPTITALATGWGWENQG